GKSGAFDRSTSSRAFSELGVGVRSLTAVVPPSAMTFTALVALALQVRCSGDSTASATFLAEEPRTSVDDGVLPRLRFNDGEPVPEDIETADECEE
ncbi:unnamed protein product, partial [Dibothriocephalus latus]